MSKLKQYNIQKLKENYQKIINKMDNELEIKYSEGIEDLQTFARYETYKQVLCDLENLKENKTFMQELYYIDLIQTYTNQLKKLLKKNAEYQLSKCDKVKII
jgi:predicted nucleotide-binding protein (sugar kinase/HSP70/actin superfamily)